MLLIAALVAGGGLSYSQCNSHSRQHRPAQLLSPIHMHNAGHLQLQKGRISFLGRLFVSKAVWHALRSLKLTHTRAAMLEPCLWGLKTSADNVMTDEHLSLPQNAVSNKLGTTHIMQSELLVDTQQRFSAGGRQSSTELPKSGKATGSQGEEEYGQGTCCLCRVRIRDLVMSPMWYELMELRAGADPDQPQEGWFSVACAVRVRNMFLHLDQDRNNHLSKREFAA